MKLRGKLKTKSASEIGHTRVGVGFEGLDRELYRPECCYDLAAATGAQLVRTQSGWIRCENERGVYSFDWLDEIVDSLISRGMKPWFNVGYGHPMYMKDIKNHHLNKFQYLQPIHFQLILSLMEKHLFPLKLH